MGLFERRLEALHFTEADREWFMRIVKEAKNEFPVDSELVSIMATGKGKLGVYNCDPHEIMKWFLKWFGKADADTEKQ